MAKTQAERNAHTKKMEEQADRLKTTRVQIFCDGAISNNGKSDAGCGGWGAVLLYKDNVKEIYGGSENSEETNNTMEITAAIEALYTLKRKDIPVDIYSDSGYVINCFKEKWHVGWVKNGWKNSKGQAVANKNLWLQLINLVKDFKEVEWHKVNGHTKESKYNNRADELAVLGKEEAKARKGE